MENLLQTPDLITNRNGRLNKWELAIIVADKNSKKIAAFEKNLLYTDNHFIISYKLSQTGFEDFSETGNMKLSLEDCKAIIGADQNSKEGQLGLSEYP